MKNKTFQLATTMWFTLMTLSAPIGATEYPQVEVTYYEAVTDGVILLNYAMQSDGKKFALVKGFGSNAGSFNYVEISETTQRERQLPDWVEFKWQETTHQEISRNSKDLSKELDLRIQNLTDSLPYKTQRVKIKNRVPVDVIDKIIDEHNKVPVYQETDAMLRLSFYWTESDIKFHWYLLQGKLGEKRAILQEGGDALPEKNNK